MTFTDSLQFRGYSSETDTRCAVCEATAKTNWQYIGKLQETTDFHLCHDCSRKLFISEDEMAITIINKVAQAPIFCNICEKDMSDDHRRQDRPLSICSDCYEEKLEDIKINNYRPKKSDDVGGTGLMDHPDDFVDDFGIGEDSE